MNPLISIVIPVYNLEDYLDQCLDSILQQDFTDIEIIAVDGGSTDKSATILDDRAEKSRANSGPRITLVREPRIGPGKARNIGIERASGQYIWFVDGDDTITADSLSPIASKLTRDRPDVLFVDSEQLKPDGDVERGWDDDLIRRAPEACSPLAALPWVIDLSMVCWNKVINREFLLSTGLSFSIAWPQEEVPLSCLILLEAMRLSTLKLVCYRYRLERPGSVMMAGDQRRHFRIFNAYETVLDRAQKKLANNDPALSDEIYSAYFRRAIRHFATIYEGGRTGARYIPRQLRREFFDRMHFEYLHYKPAGYRPGRSPLERKFQMIEAGEYRRYNVLIPMNRLRVRARDCLTGRRPSSG